MGSHPSKSSSKLIDREKLQVNGTNSLARDDRCRGELQKKFFNEKVIEADFKKMITSLKDSTLSFTAWEEHFGADSNIATASLLVKTPT